MSYQSIKKSVEKERKNLQQSYESGSFSFASHLSNNVIVRAKRAGLLKLPASHPAAVLDDKAA